MKIKNTILIYFCLVQYPLFAQYFATEIGYKYKSTNHLSVGVSYRISEQYKKNPININASYVSDFERSNYICIGVQKRFKEIFEGGINLTTKDIELIVGLNFFNILKLNVGYTFYYQNYSSNQFTFGLNIAIAKKYSKYKDQFNFIK